MSANDPNTTNTFVETTIDVTECPLCGEMLQGLLTNLVEMPTDKLGDVKARRTQMKMTAVSFELYRHNCEKVDPRPEQAEFRTRPHRATWDELVSSKILTAEDFAMPQVPRGGARYGQPGRR